MTLTLGSFIAAVDGAGLGECDFSPDIRVEVEAFVIQFQVVVDGVVGFDEHFS